MSRITAGKRLRFTPLALTTVLLSAGLLSLSVTGSLSGFTAAIQNTANSAASGTLTMQESGPNSSGTTVSCNSTDGGSIATNSASCGTINKFGGSTTMVPGGPAVTTSVVIKNTGTVTANTFTVAGGSTCTQSGSVTGSATDFCSKLNLTITQGATSVFSGTVGSFVNVSKSLPAMAAGASATYVFSVSLDSSATTAYQGLTASLPITWTFNS